MDSFTANDISFTIKRDDSERVIGFAMQGRRYEAEAFCTTFPFAQSKGKADITMDGDVILFTQDGINITQEHPQLATYGSSGPGSFRPEISAEDAHALFQIVMRSGEYAEAEFEIALESAWGRGFSLTLASATAEAVAN